MLSIDHDHIRQRLRAVLEATSISQEKLAARAGISVSSIQIVLRGEHFGEKVATGLHEALTEIERSSSIGGLDYAAKVERLEEEVAALRSDMSEALELLRKSLSSNHDGDDPD